MRQKNIYIDEFSCCATLYIIQARYRNGTSLSFLKSELIINYQLIYLYVGFKNNEERLGTT